MDCVVRVIPLKNTEAREDQRRHHQHISQRQTLSHPSTGHADMVAGSHEVRSRADPTIV